MVYRAYGTGYVCTCVWTTLAQKDWTHDTGYICEPSTGNPSTEYGANSTEYICTHPLPTLLQTQVHLQASPANPSTKSRAYGTGYICACSFANFSTEYWTNDAQYICNHLLAILHCCKSIWASIFPMIFFHQWSGIHHVIEGKDKKRYIQGYFVGSELFPFMDDSCSFSVVINLKFPWKFKSVGRGGAPPPNKRPVGNYLKVIGNPGWWSASTQDCRLDGGGVRRSNLHWTL